MNQEYRAILRRPAAAARPAPPIPAAICPAAICPAAICAAAIWAAAICALALGALATCAAPSRAADPATEQPDWDAARRRMVDDDVAAAGIRDPRVLAAMRATPRHEFVPPDQQANAYWDMALPIGEAQTISPPFVVAYMTEQLEPQPGDRVLEIGTGSGYQAAVLSGLVAEVYTIEIVEELALRARSTLERLGYENIQVKIGDGYQGWPDQAPFDKIIVTCSPEKVPRPLVDQLREGGSLVIPVGERYQQTLYRYRKVDGRLQAEPLEPTMFVPMTGAAERQRLVKPDPLRPELVNGDFETELTARRQPPGWYYVRQGRVLQRGDALEQGQCLELTNEVPGRAAQALQAFGIDGRRVARLAVNLSVRAEGIQPGQTPHQLPRAVLMFYDDQRAPAGQQELGPWRDDMDWQSQQALLRVPRNARLAVLAVGMFGATGRVALDDVSIEPLRTNPSVLPR